MSTAIPPAIRDLLRFTRTHLRHHEALMRATGGHFNLFQILGIGHYEVKTHSPILAELLNPKGRHGQGDVFLRLFLERLGIDDPPFQTSSTRVETERYIGPKTESEGGQIDIVIEDGVRRRVLIENKIYAGDQDNQLLRYHNYDKDAVLIYLTRFGHEATEYSAQGLKADLHYQKCSYEKEIRNWLMECRNEAACLPSVREMLSQYIGLIEELTHRSTTKEMNKELIDEILRDPESYDAFCTLRDADSVVRDELITRLDVALTGIATELSLKRTGSFDGLGSKFGGFGFTSEKLRQYNLTIDFEFGASNFNDLYFGFGKAHAEMPCPVEESIRQAFKQQFDLKETNEYWIAWSSFEKPYSYWGCEAFEGVRSGRFAETVKENLVALLLIADEACGLPTDIKVIADAS